MSRKQKLILNTSLSICHKIISVICAFILPRLIISTYGSSVNGLTESIANFLGFISMLEMGITSVIDANLYKPLALKDYDKVNDIFVSSKRFFRKIALIFVAYVIILIFIFPQITDSFDPVFTSFLIVIIAISTFSQYYFGMSYRILINADQKGYIVTILQGITIILNTVISVILIKLNLSIHVVKLAIALTSFIQPIFLFFYVKHKYHLNERKIIKGEPIKQKWNGLAQHLAFIVSTKADIVILTVFSTLLNVSIYGVYILVLSGLTTIFDAIYVGVSPMIGNMFANEEKETLNKTFSAYDWVSHFSTTLLFSICGVLIVPFVKLYTSGIVDAKEYIVPVFACLITLAYAIQVLRTPYKTLVHVAGHFKQTQTSAIIEMILNIVISIIAVFNFGLIGVAIGTIVAMTYRTLYFVWYLSKNIVHRPIKYFLRSIAVDIISAFAIILPAILINVTCSSYFDWVIYAIIISVWGIISSLLINLIFSKNTIKSFIKLLKSKTSI